MNHLKCTGIRTASGCRSLRSLAVNRAITALVRAVLPDTVVRGGMNITRNLSKLEGDTGLRVLRVEGHCRFVGWAGRAKPVCVTSQAVFAAWPLRNGELPCFLKVTCLTSVWSVSLVVEPLKRARATAGVSMAIPDIDLVVRVHGLVRGALRILAELKFSVLEPDAFIAVRVIGTVESEFLAVLTGEHIAFA